MQDKIGPKKVATIGGIMYGGGLILASFVTSLPMLYSSYGVLGGAGVAFSYGGFLAVFPTLTGGFYGVNNLGANYGVVYQAYGIAALIGPIIKSNSSDFNQTFMIAALCAVVGGIMTVVLKASSKESEQVIRLEKSA